MKITEKRGYKDNYDRGSELVVFDIRQGKLGRYTLDRYEELGEKMKEPIKTIKERLFAEEVDPAYVAQLMADERSGVQKLITKYQNQQRKQRQMQEKYAEMSVFEQELYQKGLRFVAGLDEVGRGPLAGPVVAATVVLPKNCGIIGLNDSKQLSAKKRRIIY